MTVDRRVLRTKRLLREALFDLIASKGYDNLTVNEIADQADVGRATFYIHYKDKDELLQDALREEFQAFVQHMQSNYDVDQRLRRVLEYIREHAAHFKVLLTGVGNPNVHNFIRNFMMSQILMRLQARTDAQPTMPLPVIALHMAGSVLNMIVWWLENDQVYSVEQMENFCQQLIGDGVWKVMGLEPNRRIM